MSVDKLDMQSPDLVNQNIEKLALLFPNCVTESNAGKAIDFDLLRQELSHAVVDGNKERYRLEWPGKKEAIVKANLPTTRTLRPALEDSVDFDSTQNIYIEGDNLEVLKLLQESYLGKIKMIYIDPPYNTGNDFVYKDNFAKGTQEELFESGQKDEYNHRLVVNPATAGRYHSDWLSMMYPRLKLARNLLKEDGAILINIDEHEISNLLKILEELFGKSNDIGTIVWDKRNPKGDSLGISYQHEYIVAFAKNIEVFMEANKLVRPKRNADKILKKAASLFKTIGPNRTLADINKEFSHWINAQKEFTGGEKAYKKIDEKGRVYRGVSMAWPNKKKAPDGYYIPLLHPITKKPCPVPERGWRNPSSTMKTLLEKGLILFGEDETKQPERKYLLEDNMFENLPSLIYYGGSDTELLHQMGIPFDTPKVVDICKEHIHTFTKNNDIILDFFSGSSTIAHAVMKLNAEEQNGRRKYILVQLPEITYEGVKEEYIDSYGNKKWRYVIDRQTGLPQLKNHSETSKAGYKSICEIGKERIRRAAKKIQEESGANIDYGFRVYRLDETNMQDVYYKPREYAQARLDLFADNVKSDRTSDDLLAQVMLDWGLPLSLKIERLEIAGKEVFRVAEKSLYACFDKGIDETFSREIAKDQPLRIVFRDSGFRDDTAKVNVKQLLKQLSPDTEMKVI